MLEHFFISKVRVKILKLYIEDAADSYHVRDVVRKVGEEINAVRRELINLEKAGLFTREPKFNRVYYTLRKDYPIYNELKSLICKEYGLGGSILKEKEQLGGITFAVLSSLYVNNAPMNPSEVDLLVVGDNINMERLSLLVRTIEVDKHREINYAVLSTEQFEQQKKKVDGYLRQLINRSKLFLIGDEDAFLS